MSNKAAKQAETTQQNPQFALIPPAVGQVWPGQGGVYAGIIRDGARLWHLILAITPESVIRAEWGGFGESEDQSISYVDGLANTLALVASHHSHPAALQIAALVIDGHNDFYLAAQKENNLIYINTPEHLDPEWHWSSTQYSARLAWIQDFVAGFQDVDSKGLTLAARAVRRLPIE